MVDTAKQQTDIQKTTTPTIEELIQEVADARLGANLEIIKKAYNFAKELHKDQKRKSGEPYIIHPLSVAMILAKMNMDESTIAAALLHDTNTSLESAQNLIDFARGIDVNINLIPWNPVQSLPFTEPSQSEIKMFTDTLEKAGLNVTLRTRRGRKIGGACGQLGRTTK